MPFFSNAKKTWATDDQREIENNQLCTKCLKELQHLKSDMVAILILQQNLYYTVVLNTFFYKWHIHKIYLGRLLLINYHK